MKGSSLGSRQSLQEWVTENSRGRSHAKIASLETPHQSRANLILSELSSQRDCVTSEHPKWDCHVSSRKTLPNVGLKGNERHSMASSVQTGTLRLAIFVLQEPQRPIRLRDPHEAFVKKHTIGITLAVERAWLGISLEHSHWQGSVRECVVSSRPASWRGCSSGFRLINSQTASETLLW